MTSRTPRDTRLRLVPRRPIAAARRSVTAAARSRAWPAHGSSAPRPPEGTPSPAALARHARAVLGSAERMARWVADEPPTSGVPTPEAFERAAAELRRTPAQVRGDWDRARLAGLVEVHGDTARPGWRLRAWERDDSAVLRGWVALFDAWSLARPTPADAADPVLVGEVVVAMPQLLSLLHLSAGPVTLPALHDLLAQRITELRSERESGVDLPDTPDPSLPALLGWALDGLASVGALTRCDARDPGEARDAREPAARTTPTAALTPLGNWAVWTKLEQICVAAQSPAGNIEQSAEDMLRGCAQLTPGPSRAECRAWLAARPTGPAVTELLEAARGEDALIRGLAFEALRVVGAPAEPDVRAAADEPTLRPYALLWLAELDGADPEELAGGASGVLTREEATWLWVDTAAAVTDHGEGRLLVDHLDTAVQGSVPDLLDEVRAAGHPRTVQVLVALAAAHPDPALAKAVRRAAFQVHTGDV
ncbi:hypothetical protein DVA86_17655 [Streptomyces armeniacus]|uniref:Uncharacterized protein n=1 Tax=Streptomyces armeniacus TaxID=83291 RepID=A0A345XRD8_9ACTN|nr:hypothetical protein [Streptomyces armeniacus]AXK34204.1 hypothetical protein DVA86_17655 [Streptomyces armeniacus]